MDGSLSIGIGAFGSWAATGADFKTGFGSNIDGGNANAGPSGDIGFVVRTGGPVRSWRRLLQVFYESNACNYYKILVWC